MAYIRMIVPEDPFYPYHRGVARAKYIGQDEFKTLMQKVYLSAEQLKEKNQAEFESKWQDRLVLGQHETGQLQAVKPVTEHAYVLRGRIFVDEG